MRTLAAYAFTSSVDTPEEEKWRFKIYRDTLNDWLRDEGISDPTQDTADDTYLRLTRRDIEEHEGGSVHGFLFQRPILEASHLLHTQLDLAVRETEIALYLRISLQRLAAHIAPVSVSAKCPRAVLTILDSGDWRSGNSRVRPRHHLLRGEQGARDLSNLLFDPDRHLPIVALAHAPSGQTSLLSEDPEEASENAFLRWLEDDLSGTALIMALDEDAVTFLQNVYRPADAKEIRYLTDHQAILEEALEDWEEVKRESLEGKQREEEQKEGVKYTFIPFPDVTVMRGGSSFRIPHPSSYGGRHFQEVYSGNKERIRLIPNWSFGSSIARVYWPMAIQTQEPQQHPAWAWRETYYTDDYPNDPDFDWEAERFALPPSWVNWSVQQGDMNGLRQSIRDTIYEQAGQQPAPDLIRKIRNSYIAAERRRLEEAGDVSGLTELYDELQEQHDRIEEERDALEERLGIEQHEREDEQARLNSRIRQLEHEVSELRRGGSTEAETDDQAVPETLEQVQHQATTQCTNLVFGEDVWPSAQKIKVTPSIVQKIFNALTTLNEATSRAREDTLEASFDDYLYNPGGYKSSPDNGTPPQQRTWDDGSGQRREFSKHLKLKEATSRNEAARIYYEFQSDAGKTIVPYIGPHL